MRGRDERLDRISGDRERRRIGERERRRFAFGDRVVRRCLLDRDEEDDLFDGVDVLDSFCLPGRSVLLFFSGLASVLALSFSARATVKSSSSLDDTIFRGFVDGATLSFMEIAGRVCCGCWLCKSNSISSGSGSAVITSSLISSLM